MSNTLNIPIPGIKLLDFGSPGSGKTFGTRTIPKEFEVFYLFTENSQALIADLPNAHWHYVSPMGSADWSTLKAIATSINTLDNDKLQTSPIGKKREFTQWLEMIDALNNFKDDRTGEVFGDVCKWGTDRVLVLDGLTGITKMSRSLQAGLKPLLTQPDFGVIMQNISFILDFLTSNLRCHLILIAHIEMEKDEVSGTLYKNVSTIGRKLAPTIPGLFDDVVASEQVEGKFLWRTVDTRSVTKSRLLPLGSEMPHDYKLVFDSWKAKGGKVVATA